MIPTEKHLDGKWPASSPALLPMTHFTFIIYQSTVIPSQFFIGREFSDQAAQPQSPQACQVLLTLLKKDSIRVEDNSSKQAFHTPRLISPLCVTIDTQETGLCCIHHIQVWKGNLPSTTLHADQTFMNIRPVSPPRFIVT